MEVHEGLPSGHGGGAAKAMGEIERRGGRDRTKKAPEDECGWTGEDCSRRKGAVGEGQSGGEE